MKQMIFFRTKKKKKKVRKMLPYHKIFVPTLHTRVAV